MKKDIAIMMKSFGKDIVSNIRIYILKMLVFYPFCFLFIWKNADLSDLQYLFCWISVISGVGVFLFFYCLRHKKWYGICSGLLILGAIWMWDDVNRYDDFEYKMYCLSYGYAWDSVKKECVGD